MSLEEVQNNLGTIARCDHVVYLKPVLRLTCLNTSRSGSKEFMESLGGDGNASARDKIIGQFGVGFYSGTNRARGGCRGSCPTLVVGLPFSPARIACMQASWLAMTSRSTPSRLMQATTLSCGNRMGELWPLPLIQRQAFPDPPCRLCPASLGDYTVAPASNVPRGMSITIKLRDDAEEFADPNRIR